MGDVLVALLVFLLVTGLAVLTTGWWLLRRARRSLRIGRRPVGNRPPLVWLVSPKPLPRLHTRVRRTVVLVRDVYPAPPRRRKVVERHAYAEYADRLEGVAAALGAELVHASHLPKGPRQEAGRWLTAQVRDLEVTATSLCRAASVPGARSADATATLHRDVARLEAAQRELDELFPPVVWDRPSRPTAGMRAGTATAGVPTTGVPAAQLEPPVTWPPPLRVTPTGEPARTRR